MSKTKLGGIAAATVLFVIMVLRLALAPTTNTGRAAILSTSDTAAQSPAAKPRIRQLITTSEIDTRPADAAGQIHLQVASANARSMIACHQLLSIKREAEFRLAIPADGATLEQLIGRESELGNFGEQLRKREHACDSVDADAVSKNLYQSLLFAAKLGDSDAASCYTSAIFPQNADQLQSEQIAEFQNNARSFLDDGIKRGDWRFVEIAALAASRFSVRDHHANLRAWNRQLLPADRATAYGYDRLLRYGMSGELAEQADRSLAAQRENLDTAEVDAMEKWARDQYLRYFQSSPVLTELPQTCPM
jgi:hypothetical protein